MDLNDALHSCRCGAFIRDDSGTMKFGWKLKFVPDLTPSNMIKPAYDRDGTYVYIRPTGEDAHPIKFHDGHRASWQWTTVSGEYPPPTPVRKT